MLGDFTVAQIAHRSRRRADRLVRAILAGDVAKVAANALLFVDVAMTL